MLKNVFVSVSALLLLLLGANQASAQNVDLPLQFYSEIVAPYYWLDAEDQAQGAAVDLALALIEIIDRNATLSHLPWARAVVETQKRPNIILLTALRTDSRENELQWLGKVGETKAYLIGLKERELPQLQSLEDAKGLKVATIRGYGAATFLLDNGFVEGENLDLFVRVDQLWSMLYRQRVDAVLMNLSTSPFEIAQAQLDPAAIRPLLHITELTINLEMATGNSTSAETVLQIQNGLQQLKDNGTYQAIMSRWGL